MRKALSVTKTVLVWLLVALSVLMMVFTLFSVTAFDSSDRDLFGYKLFIVLSDSMKTELGDEEGGYFAAGDLILVKEVAPETLKAGDVISFLSTNPDSYGETVTHKIRALTSDKKGNPGFVTYGTSTGAEDANVVTYPYVLGRYVRRIPLMGQLFRFLKTTPGYLVCILLPFLLLIGIQGYHSVSLFKQYKKEQTEAMEAERIREKTAIEAERAALAEERKKQEELMQRLLEMQKALEKEKGSSGESDSPPST